MAHIGTSMPPSTLILIQCCDLDSFEQMHMLTVDEESNPRLTLSHSQRIKLIKFEDLRKLVLDVQSGLKHGHGPIELSDDNGKTNHVHHPSLPASDFGYGELVAGCCGGTYRMRNGKGQQCAIFKPVDEEPYAPYNPKGYSGSMHVKSAMKPGICVGGGASRECAAYLLDHTGLASVPTTAMLYITHSAIVPGKVEVQIKVGSLQRFFEHRESSLACMGTFFSLHVILLLRLRTWRLPFFAHSSFCM